VNGKQGSDKTGFLGWFSYFRLVDAYLMYAEEREVRVEV
jgi:hypothetical protein